MLCCGGRPSNSLGQHAYSFCWFWRSGDAQLLLQQQQGISTFMKSVDAGSPPEARTLVALLSSFCMLRLLPHITQQAAMCKSFRMPAKSNSDESHGYVTALGLT